jgi:ADP-heptose:LPS heptosyltransferase
MKSIVALALSKHNLYDAIQISVDQKAKFNCEQLTIVTYKSNESFFATVNNIDHIIYIDENKIRQIFKSPIYPVAFAINEFLSNLEPLMNKEWDFCLNIYNSPITNYIAGALNARNTIGSKIDTGSRVDDTNWSKIESLNSTMGQHSIDKESIWRKRFATQFHNNAFKIDETKSSLASTNLSRIKKQLKRSNDSKFVGVIVNESTTKDIDSYAYLFNSLFANEMYIPLAIFDKNNDRSDFIDRLNEKVRHDIISIECTQKALPSVIINLNAIIAESSPVISLANYLDIPTIELMSTNDDLYGTFTRTVGNFIICSHEVPTNEACLSLNQLFATELEVEAISSRSRIYYITEDESYARYKTVHGPFNLEEQITKRLNEYLIDTIFSENKSQYPFASMNSEQSTMLKSICEQRRFELTGFVKKILSCMRLLKSASSSKEKAMSFFAELGELIHFRSEDFTIRWLAATFEDSAQNVKSSTFSERLRLLEIKLFELKDKVQIYKDVLEIKPRDIERSREENIEVRNEQTQ